MPSFHDSHKKKRFKNRFRSENLNIIIFKMESSQKTIIFIVRNQVVDLFFGNFIPEISKCQGANG